MLLTRYMIALVCLLATAHLTSADSLEAWRAKLTFHASFDQGPDADFALGDQRIYTATSLTRDSVQPGLTAAHVQLAADGRWGKCLRFNDVSEHVVFFQGGDNLPYATDGFDATVSLWMKLTPDEDLKPGYVDPLQITDDQWNNSAVFLDFTQDDTPRHFRLGVFADYKFWNPHDTPWEEIAVDQRPMVVVTQSPFNRDRWTHVAFVLKGINSSQPALARLYLDGQPQGDLKRVQQFTWDPQRLAILLGIQYIGAIDDFAVFRGAMSDAEIQALAKLPSGVAQLAAAAQPAADSEWIQLFNGKDLNGWQVKIRGYELGNNFGNTFRVVDGAIQVGYEAYEQFDQRYGHLFYRQPYANYDLRVEYRFIGQQATGGEGWATRNSGVMVHGQDPGTMTQDQRFPVSIEVQLLGGAGSGQRTTANLCTPGTHVVMDGNLIKRHCTNSSSQTYHGDQWVTVLIRVRGNRLIEHVIDGKRVLSYTQPQLDDSDEDAQRLLASQDRMLSSGTISLQSESHPVEFRKVELRVVNESSE